MINLSGTEEQKSLKNSLSEMHSQCFDKCWSAAQFADLEYITEDEMGFIAYQIAADECEIKTLCVLPPYRRSGIGQKLMQKFLDAVKAKKIFLEVSEKNIAAINLYTKLGFKTYSRRKNYYPSGDDALLMQKLLAN